MKSFKRYLEKVTSHEGPCENHCDKCKAGMQRLAFFVLVETVMIYLFIAIVIAAMIVC